MNLRGLMLGVAAALLFASCGTPCTLIGCSSTLEFTLSSQQVSDLQAGVASIRACVDGDCATVDSTQVTVIDRTLQLSRTTSDAAGTADVTLNVTRNGTELFAGSWTGAAVTTFAPNGETCGPVCSRIGPLTVP